MALIISAGDWFAQERATAERMVELWPNDRGLHELVREHLAELERLHAAGRIGDITTEGLDSALAAFRAEFMEGG